MERSEKFIKKYIYYKSKKFIIIIDRDKFKRAAYDICEKFTLGCLLCLAFSHARKTQLPIIVHLEQIRIFQVTFCSVLVTIFSQKLKMASITGLQHVL